MSSPSSCFRCSRPQALLSPGGLCPECAGTAGTADATPADPPAGPALSTATNAPPGPSSATPTGRPAAWSATASVPPDVVAVLPDAPPGHVLLRRLGGGGMGDVYLARESPSDRLVALKFLRRADHPDALARFVNEMRVLASRLDHPGIVRVYASDFLRAVPYFTMEYAEGGSLADALRPRPDAPEPGRLPVSEAVRLTREVAGAVAAAHTKGVIHRDLKPHNVLLGAGGAVKVADFGLAKLLDDTAGLTETCDTLGTPNYMPPEQVSRRNGAVGAPADVYGLGATLYHLLTGRPPFVGDTRQDVIEQVLNDRPARPRALRPELPLGLEAVVLKCLEKDPADRYASAEALLADLDRAEAGEPDAPPMTRARRAKLWAKRRRRAIGAGLTAVLAVAGAFALGAAYWPKPVPLPPAPADPLAEMRAELAAGRAVALVGPTGPPRYSRSLLESVTVGESPHGDGTCAFHAFDVCLLELWPDPGHQRYRLSADVRQLHPRNAAAGAPPTDYVGVYFGYGAGSDRDRTAHAAFAVTFEDYPARRGAATRTVWLRRLGFVQSGTELLKEDSGKPRSLPFAPAPARPGPWRRVVLDVSPAEVVVRWCAAPDERPDALEVLARWPDPRWPDERAETQYAVLKRKVGGRDPGAAAALPEWSPRMPLGVISSRSSVAVRNVILTPNP